MKIFGLKKSLSLENFGLEKKSRYRSLWNFLVSSLSVTQVGEPDNFVTRQVWEIQLPDFLAAHHLQSKGVCAKYLPGFYKQLRVQGFDLQELGMDNLVRILKDRVEVLTRWQHRLKSDFNVGFVNVDLTESCILVWLAHLRLTPAERSQSPTRCKLDVWRSFKRSLGGPRGRSTRDWDIWLGYSFRQCRGEEQNGDHAS